MYSDILNFGRNRPIGFVDTNFWKKYVQFCMVPIYSKTMANIKKTWSWKWFYFTLLRLYTNFCAILSTVWKVANVRYIPPPFRPTLWHQQASGFWFHVGPYFILITNPNKNGNLQTFYVCLIIVSVVSQLRICRRLPPTSKMAILTRDLFPPLFEVGGT